MSRLSQEFELHITKGMELKTAMQHLTQLARNARVRVALFTNSKRLRQKAIIAYGQFLRITLGLDNAASKRRTFDEITTINEIT